MIIGITGPAGCGKDTIAKFLVKRGFKRYAFADELKQVANNLFNWDERHANGELKEVIDPYWGFSPRNAYQLLGTEFGRALNPDLWVLKANKVLTNHKKWIISDVRFENEANFIRKKDGIIIHIFGRKKDIDSIHTSENGIKINRKDYIIENNGTIEELQNKLLSITPQLKTEGLEQ